MAFSQPPSERIKFLTMKSGSLPQVASLCYACGGCSDRQDKLLKQLGKLPPRCTSKILVKVLRINGW
ncbi:hypothetical protein [Nostoc sp. FACHB-888]|uniref:hypothetical protein n=1 Tax=Nostoc sp. FACHB-888 TaxID=2692842 RepID=UPI001688A69C|nr:hypothetical protein [Nostoc sp. FACHB-888]MBD2243262.1 hypothetical protein [Nostoc sp. FACHB-888]